MLYTITKKMTKKEIKIFENIIGKKIKRIFVRGMPKQLTIVDGMDLFEVILEMENEKIKICCPSFFHPFLLQIEHIHHHQFLHL